jgi:hypothetical protein
MNSTTIEMEREGEIAHFEAADSLQVQTVPQYDDINIPLVVMVGLVSAIVTIVTIFFVQGLCYQWQNSFIRERSFDTVNQSVVAIIEGQKKLLNGDPEKEIKPLQQSIDEVLESYGTRESK